MGLTPGYQFHLPPHDYIGNSPIIKQDTILMESEIQHAGEVLELMYEMMAKTNPDKWPITGHIQIIPVRPSGIMDENLIGKYAMMQNCHTASLESYTLRVYKNIDDTLLLKNGNEMTLREIILYSKTDGNFLFEMVERASGDRIFLVYLKHGSNNTRRKQVRNFASQLQRELNEMIIPECLEIIISTTSEIRTYNERATTDSFTRAHNTYAEMLLNNTLDEEDIENINAYPKKNPRNTFSPINQQPQTILQKINHIPKLQNHHQK